MIKRRIAIAILAVCAALLTACAPAITALPQTDPDVLLNITDDVLDACQNDYPLAAIDDTLIMHSDVVIHRPLNPDMSDEELLEGLILLEIAYQKCVAEGVLLDYAAGVQQMEAYNTLKAAVGADGVTTQDRDRYDRLQQFMKVCFPELNGSSLEYSYIKYMTDQDMRAAYIDFYRGTYEHPLPEGLTEEEQEHRFVKHLQQLKKEYEITYYKH